MAGHSKFKNIQHRKAAQDNKKAKIFTKLAREITTAAKLGGPDMDTNPRLRSAIQTARAHNLPKERIDRGVAQASGVDSSTGYTEIRYEGYANDGIAIIVEASTDNKNRTASAVRAAFSKYGGNLGETGSVSFMFDRVGMIEYSAEKITNEEMLDLAINAGANDVISDEDSHWVYTSVEDFADCLKFLTDKIGIPVESYLGWKPKNTLLIDDVEKAKKLLKFIGALEENEDVAEVFGNYEFSEEVNNAPGLFE